MSCDHQHESQPWACLGESRERARFSLSLPSTAAGRSGGQKTLSFWHRVFFRAIPSRGFIQTLYSCLRAIRTSGTRRMNRRPRTGREKRQKIILQYCLAVSKLGKLHQPPRFLIWLRFALCLQSQRRRSSVHLVGGGVAGHNPPSQSQQALPDANWSIPS